MKPLHRQYRTNYAEHVYLLVPVVPVRPPSPDANAARTAMTVVLPPAMPIAAAVMAAIIMAATPVPTTPMAMMATAPMHLLYGATTGSIGR